MAGAYLVENGRGERAWASAQARWRAAGEPVTIADWLPTPPTAERNFAMNPVFLWGYPVP
jgi:hypothetical protein